MRIVQGQHEMSRKERLLNPVPQQTDHIIRGDDSGKPLFFVHYGQREQVVFIEHFRHIFF